MPAATPAPGRPPGDSWPADDPWLDEPPGPPPPWPSDDADQPPSWRDDPGPGDPEDILAWLDAELAKAGSWLAHDPGWDDPAVGSRGRETPVEVFKAGRWDRSRANGGGFAAGGLADRLPPGPGSRLEP